MLYNSSNFLGQMIDASVNNTFGTVALALIFIILALFLLFLVMRFPPVFAIIILSPLLIVVMAYQSALLAIGGVAILIIVMVLVKIFFWD